jgi:hypothetical protein
MTSHGVGGSGLAEAPLCRSHALCLYGGSIQGPFPLSSAAYPSASRRTLDLTTLGNRTHCFMRELYTYPGPTCIFDQRDHTGTCPSLSGGAQVALCGLPPSLDLQISSAGRIMKWAVRDVVSIQITSCINSCACDSYPSGGLLRWSCMMQRCWQVLLLEGTA